VNGLSDISAETSSATTAAPLRISRACPEDSASGRAMRFRGRKILADEKLGGDFGATPKGREPLRGSLGENPQSGPSSRYQGGGLGHLVKHSTSLLSPLDSIQPRSSTPGACRQRSPGGHTGSEPNGLRARVLGCVPRNVGQGTTKGRRGEMPVGSLTHLSGQEAAKTRPPQT
jgi:hypothetical protein